MISIGSARGSARKPTGVGGRIFLTLFFAFFLAVGLAATYFVARNVGQNLATYRWKQVDAIVVSSTVMPAARNGDDPKLAITYRYRYEGKEFTSSQYARGMVSAQGATEVHQLAGKLPAGQPTRAFVNPSNPAEAVLHRSTPLAALIVLFPLIFVGVGLGGVIFAWRTGRVPAGSSQTGSTLSSSGKALGCAPVILFGAFFLMGGGMSYPFFIRPVMEIREARTWPEVPCEILDSRVRSHSGDKSTTYSVEVSYRYQINGRTFTSARYRFMSGSSSGYDAKAETVRRLPVGSRTVCYVNPADPTDAVLDRSGGWEIWLGLIPVGFALIGVLGLFGLAFKGGKTKAAPITLSDGAPTLWLKLPSVSASGELVPIMSRRGKLFGLLLVALFWNGIVSIFVWNVVADWKRGDHQWGTALFLSLFVLVGLGLFGAVVHQALALFNPRPRLRVSEPAVPLGSSLRVEWSIDGRLDRLQDLHIFLEGREEATYRRGTDTKTDRQVFRVLELITTTDPGTMRAGSGKIAIPADTMHSFEARNNKVIWVLKVRGKIPRWPDIDDDFSIVILPHRTTP